MKKLFFLLSTILLGSTLQSQAKVDFDTWFDDTTLRADYIFAGDSVNQELSLDALTSYEAWAGRRVNLDSLYIQGNGQVTVRDEASKKIIYRTSFSSLFQEWQLTKEASSIRKAFENPIQLPMPKKPALITVELRDTHHNITSSFTHRVDPKDILIRNLTNQKQMPHRYLLKSGNCKDKIDIAIVAEGYTEEEMETFYNDAQIACDALFEHEPFKEMKDRFNVFALASTSQESGVSIPGKGIWKNTAVNSHFNTFYSDRYLTTLHLKQLHNLLTSLPYEHIIILANTDNYGGGGILNSYTLTTTHSAQFRPVVVHEFGHSFAGLADEYFYDDHYTEFYPTSVEPWEKNITTLVDFDQKWKNQLPKGTKIPSKADGKPQNIYTRIGVYEGAGYQSKGVYRAYQECRMKINEAPAFCGVCQKALKNLIQFYTQE